MNSNLDYQKNKNEINSQIVIDKAIRIATVLDYHMSEKYCDHKLKQILMDVFELNENKGHWALNPTTQTDSSAIKPQEKPTT